MVRTRTAVLLILLGMALPGTWPAAADTAATPAGVVVDDFTYLDTSGEPTDQSAAHERRLRAFETALRRDVEMKCSSGIRVVGAIKKMSTLVLWAKIGVVDVGRNRTMSEKVYTFRGDNDEAWNRAEAFVARDVRELLTACTTAIPAAAPAPIRIAVFDFELEDMSAAGSATDLAPADATYLADVTKGVREQFVQSGRYQLVETGGADAAAVKKRDLRNCNGCDTGVARELGADQALVGVVRRISRMEYVVQFQIRDSKTGAVLSKGDSGLRMGADYSWSRGAVRLVRDRVLDGQPQ